MDRDAVGVELQPRWADLARGNLAYAKRRGAGGAAQVVTGDATRLVRLSLPVDRPAALVLTSPPYGPSAYGPASTAGRGATPPQHPDDLAWLRPEYLARAMTNLLADSAALLRPGGVVVLVARPWRRRGRLVDLPGLLRDAALEAGLIPLDRVAALLARLEADRVIPHASLFARTNVRAARQHGLPLSVIAHEDVLVFQTDPKGASA